VLAENENRWENLSDSDRRRVETMARAIAGRMLHEPTMKLKESAGSDVAYENVNTLRELFGLNAETSVEGDSGASVTPIRQKSEEG